jgi:inner membrane transporter RhtA
VFVLTDLRSAGRPLGFAFAFADCVGFVLYVVLGHRIANTGVGGAGSDGGGSFSGIDQLGLSMRIAAPVATPIGIGAALPSRCCLPSPR